LAEIPQPGGRQRNFTVDRLNVLWLTDITEHPTQLGEGRCLIWDRAEHQRHDDCLEKEGTAND
jgi:hypothetical protein